MVNEYVDTNKLRLYGPKCELMLVGTYQSLTKILDIRIHINNEPMKKVIVSKYLGMSIDSNLNWDDHMHDIIFKISSKIRMLRSLKRLFP